MSKYSIDDVANSDEFKEARFNVIMAAIKPFTIELNGVSITVTPNQETREFMFEDINPDLYEKCLELIWDEIKLTPFTWKGFTHGAETYQIMGEGTGKTTLKVDKTDEIFYV